MAEIVAKGLYYTMWVIAVVIGISTGDYMLSIKIIACSFILPFICGLTDHVEYRKSNGND